MIPAVIVHIEALEAALTVDSVAEAIGIALTTRKLFIVKPQRPTMGEIALEQLQGDDLKSLLLEIAAELRKLVTP